VDEPDMLLLAQRFFEYFYPTGEFVKAKRTTTSPGYVIKRSYIPRLLANFKESCALLRETRDLKYSLDEYWNSIIPGDRWVAALPSFGYQRAGYSDIEEKASEAYGFSDVA
jgi:glycosyl transferase family 25